MYHAMMLGKTYVVVDVSYSSHDEEWKVVKRPSDECDLADIQEVIPFDYTTIISI